MNILFVGGAGFIGSNVISQLSGVGDRDIHVAEPLFANIERLNGLPVTIHRIDISDTQRLRTIIITYKIEIVVHLVSTIVPGSSYDEFTKEFTSVIFPTVKLMELCAEMNIKFVYFSSGGTVYGNKMLNCCGDNNGFTEKESMAPISYYGWTKQMMENGIQFLHRTKGLKYIIIRPSNPYGPGQYLYSKQGLIAVALGKIMSHQPITVFGDGTSVRDYIYIDDLANAVCQILMKDDLENEVLNIGSGYGYSINEVLKIIRGIVPCDFEVNYVESRRSDVTSMILNNDKIKKLIKFHPVSLEEGICKFYHFINTHG